MGEPVGNTMFVTEEMLADSIGIAWIERRLAEELEFYAKDTWFEFQQRPHLEQAYFESILDTANA